MRSHHGAPAQAETCVHPISAGHEFCVELRKTVPQAVVPVIMISAKNNEDNVVEGLSHGCNDFLS